MAIGGADKGHDVALLGVDVSVDLTVMLRAYLADVVSLLPAIERRWEEPPPAAS